MTIKEIEDQASMVATNEITMLAKAGIQMESAIQERLLWLRLQATYLAGLDAGITAVKNQMSNLKGGETDAKSERLTSRTS